MPHFHPLPFCRRVGLCLALLMLAVGAARAQPAAPDDVARLAAWLAGEWNNNEQVWQQRIDAADPKLAARQEAVPHVHQVVAPVALPQFGAQVLYLQQSRGDDLGQVQAQRLIRLTPEGDDGGIRQDSIELPAGAAYLDAHRRPEVLASLTAEALRTDTGCAVIWRFDPQAQAYRGSTLAERCQDRSSRPGQVLSVQQTWQLSATQLSVLAQARDAAGQLVLGNRTDTAQRSRKVRYFQGWVWFKVAGPGAAADDKNTSFTAKYLLHSEGQRMVVPLANGSPSPYQLELALLTYQNTSRPVLKFALLDRASGKTLTYVWTNPQATTIGMNLGWFQAGVTQKAERSEFGY